MIKISLMQFEPVWEDVPANLLRAGNLINQLEEKTDLILLPEMFSTGFSINTRKICTEKNKVEAVEWMHQQAQ